MRAIQAQRRASGRVPPLVNWSVEELVTEKKTVKTILVQINRQLQKKLQHPPLKEEKEAYRPIYEVYHRVKALIAAKHTSAQEQSDPEAQAAATFKRLRAEKRALQVQLNRYERHFEALKGRSIQYQQDIEPVKEHWNRYKALKGQLAELSAQRQQQGLPLFDNDDDEADTQTQQQQQQQ
eukprot:CAMPEP_0175170062 /NCGR_PEP_ID=MMETSP0087-20121206/29984_1 /TAXON_ID=136419 /ORGANISM="Unknown Unknown, Strain D1" /LENGTH=179 /DNA_ID=CAMNT_0016460611 /DNA_START=1 /DNA_END=537 /DNA_ORIENTATION=+